MMITIMVHASKAHVDDMLACAILLVYLRGIGVLDEDINIVRANHVDTEVAGPGHYILDVGGQYDGVYLFDHHQDEEEVQGKCAATLVAEAYLPELLEDKTWGSYLRRVDLQDNKGMAEVTREMGCKHTGSLLSMERGMVTLFQTEPLKVASIVADVIEDHLSAGDEFARAKKWMATPGNTGSDVVHGVHCLVLRHNPYADGFTNVDAINTAQIPLLIKRGIGAVYSWDPRDESGGKRTLFHPKENEAGLDFTKSNPDDADAFTHKGGFLVTFDSSDEDEWKRLIWEALPW